MRRPGRSNEDEADRMRRAIRFLRLCAGFFIMFALIFPFNCHGQQPTGTVDQRVSVLIGQMLSASTEQKAFADLEMLGCQAVPSIIQQLDDRRDLPIPQISLRNKSPQAFEGIRHYGPMKVVDALAAILNQVTGRSFGFIYNGATDAERTETIKAWAKFLRDTPHAQLCRLADR